MTTGPATPGSGRDAASEVGSDLVGSDIARPGNGPLFRLSSQNRPGLDVMVALLPQSLLVPAGVALVQLKRRFDRTNTALEVGHRRAEGTTVLAARGRGGQPLHRDPPQVVLGEPQCPRQVGQRRTVAGLLIPVLDLSQRCWGESRPLGQFSLRQATSCHPVVDDRRDIGPVSQGGLPSELTPIVLTAGYRIPCAIDSANKSARTALFISLQRLVQPSGSRSERSTR